MKQQSVVESLESASLEVFYNVADWVGMPGIVVWGPEPCYLPLQSGVQPSLHALMQFAIKIIAIHRLLSFWESVVRPSGAASFEVHRSPSLNEARSRAVSAPSVPRRSCAARLRQLLAASWPGTG